jgi:hypothetical protein
MDGKKEKEKPYNINKEWRIIYRRATDIIALF